MLVIVFTSTQSPAFRFRPATGVEVVLRPRAYSPRIRRRILQYSQDAIPYAIPGIVRFPARASSTHVPRCSRRDTVTVAFDQSLAWEREVGGAVDVLRRA